MSLLIYDDVVKEGYASVKKYLYIGLWRKYCLCLRRSSSLGPTRLEVIKCKNGKLKESLDSLFICIEMDNIAYIDSSAEESKKFVLTTLNSSAKYFFSFDSYYEKEEWRSVLNVYSSDSQGTPKNIFHVYVLNNAALTFYGECRLHILERSIHLTEADNLASVLMTWPLVSLRRFNCDETKFMFETGRSCETGEGLFVFNTKEGSAIVDMISQASRDLAHDRPNSFSIPRPPLPPLPSKTNSRSRSVVLPETSRHRRINQ